MGGTKSGGRFPRSGSYPCLPVPPARRAFCLPSPVTGALALEKRCASRGLATPVDNPDLGIMRRGDRAGREAIDTARYPLGCPPKPRVTPAARQQTRMLPHVTVLPKIGRATGREQGSRPGGSGGWCGDNSPTTTTHMGATGPGSSDRPGGGDDHVAYVGARGVWGGDQPFGLRRVDRRQHVYCVGKTGTGKTTLLRNLILQDVYAGHGVGLIDPHGDLAREVLDHVPPWRTDDVVYFDPADLEHPVGFNLLQGVPTDRRHRVASGLVAAMRAIWHDSWGPRMEYILYAAVAALLDCPNATILGIPRLFVDRAYRRWVADQVRDPVVRSFWVDEFEHYDHRIMREAVAPIQNKVGQLLMSPPVRNVLGQVRRKADPRFMMDGRRIFVANLSKGALGEDKANLLGSVLVTSFELAAMGRVDVPEGDREDFFLYVDEFQNFATDGFASILSEARKYRLCLTLSHQYLDQVPDPVRHAVFGNAGTVIAFRVGERDGQLLAHEFGGGLTGGQFSSLGNHEVLVNTLSRGQVIEPFAGRTLPPLTFPGGRFDAVVRRSRERYGTPRAVVEDKIGRADAAVRVTYHAHVFLLPARICEPGPLTSLNA